MTLIKTISKFIEKEKLFEQDSVLVCGVSGGPDSMAMLDALISLNYRVIVAHVNYLLRGADSEMDQNIVINYCKEKNIEYRIKKLSSDEISELKKGNLQSKARDYRYSFFSEVQNEIGAHYICTAHNLNDVAETFFLQLVRSSSLKGLRSIQAKNGLIRRPLLSSNAKDILTHLNSNKIPYRTDQSNLDDTYDRNFIRNQIIPLLESRWPSIIPSINQSTKYLSLDHDLLESLIENEKYKWIKDSDGTKIIGPLSDLFNISSGKNLLYHFIKNFGFNHDHLENIAKTFQSSGNQYISDTHIAVTSRDYLKVEKKVIVNHDVLIIPESGHYEVFGGILTIQESSESPISTKGIVNFDGDKLKWPLRLRYWMQGDRIAPLGMKGHHKKISDILIDNKVDLLTKRKSLVLLDNEDSIIWLIDHVISDKVKYSPKTNTFINIKWNKLKG